MAIFQQPNLGSDDLRVLDLIDDLRGQLGASVAPPRRWFGTLRRMTLARAVQGSNSVEGYNASLDDVAAALDDEPTLSADEATAQALAGYRDAMTYVLQLAEDEATSVDEGLIKGLHFMMIKHELAKSPGRWRQGEIFVRDESNGQVVYTGPDAERVPGLMAELVRSLREPEGSVLVRAAMAHLNLVMIHPFRDGNGRMGRAIQTLILVRERIAAPVFSSIEEYIGRNTPSYYAVLAEVGRGAWHPKHDALPWIRYCLTAHYHQAKTQLRRVEEIEQLYAACAEVAREAGLAERTVGGLVEVSYGLRLRNASYRRSVLQTEGDEISDQTASRDLRAMVDAGLIAAHGKNRSRFYSAAPALKQQWQRVRDARPPRDDFDPYVVARQIGAPTLEL